VSAISDYSNLVRARFGDRVEGIYLFGSRARGDHRPGSDADVAVILSDGEYWSDLFELVDLAFEINATSDVYIQPRPVQAKEWAAESAPGTFLAEIKKDARRAASAGRNGR